MFTVTTPTAIVTDLGTEFGVEVEKSGTTRSHVFQGRVQVRNSNSNSRGPTARGDAASHSSAINIAQTVELTANESATVRAMRDGNARLVRETRNEPNRFVRMMPRPANQKSQIINHKSPRPSGSRLSTLNSRPSYRLTDLGTLAGAGSCAYGVNAAGQVVGASATAHGKHAFLYSNGRIKDLGTLGGSDSWAFAINASGQIVGGSKTAGGDTHAALWTADGKLKDLGTLGGESSDALRINDSGQVVGQSTTKSGVIHGFLCANGVMRDLGASAGPNMAIGINSAGQVVGNFTVSGSADRARLYGDGTVSGGASHAFLYSDGNMKDLGTLGGPSCSTIAHAANDRGLVVGWSKGVLAAAVYARQGRGDKKLCGGPVNLTDGNAPTLDCNRAIGPRVSPCGKLSRCGCAASDIIGIYGKSCLIVKRHQDSPADDIRNDTGGLSW